MSAPTTQQLQSTIEQAWENRERLSPGAAPAKIGKAVARVLDELDRGRLRVAEKVNGAWHTHQWIKKAVLLSFRLEDNRPIRAGALQFYDKVPTKFERYDRKQFERGGFRVVPPAVARHGAYIAKNVVLSGGAGIGGVLEPLQANPTIIEDSCFIGARSEIVEGVIVEENAVISMGVFIGASTRILDRASGQILYGRVPAGSVVVPGTLPSADGKYGLYCAVIVKQVDARTRAKTSINELLRGD